MPWSSPEGKDVVERLVREFNPSSVLDVGPGAGYYGTLVRSVRPGALIHGVEVWEPYIDRFQLRSIYDEVFVADVREFTPERPYDLVIFGDVIEHMTRDDAEATIRKLWEGAGHVLVSLPIIHWEQGECEGNPHEAHIHHWTHQEFSDVFRPTRSWTGPQIGVYVL